MGWSSEIVHHRVPKKNTWYCVNDNNFTLIVALSYCRTVELSCTRTSTKEHAHSYTRTLVLSYSLIRVPLVHACPLVPAVNGLLNAAVPLKLPLQWPL